jgi:xanthine/CO dehydrogenase XdhC/CoxF family maturation factor
VAANARVRAARGGKAVFMAVSRKQGSGNEEAGRSMSSDEDVGRFRA